jgi:hypothetical protein
MIVRADMCIFSKKNEPQQGSKLFIRQLRSSWKQAHWSCNFVKGVETHHVCDAKAIGPDYSLQNECFMAVGTLKAFTFSQINTEADYQLLLHDQVFQCTLDVAFLGNTATFERYARREMILPTGGNLQSVGGRICGIGDPGFVKASRR